MAPHLTLETWVTRLYGIDALDAKHFHRPLLGFCQLSEYLGLCFLGGFFGKNPTLVLPRLPSPSRHLLGLMHSGPLCA